VVVAERREVLPLAADEAVLGAKGLPGAEVLPPDEASRAKLRLRLASAWAVHFACHAYFDPATPLSSYLLLPTGERWAAAEWLNEPVAGLPLAVLSACQSGEVAPTVGGEVFGLVAGLLAGGVRSVVAGLWSIPDHPATVTLMARLYAQRMTASLPTAWRQAQLDALADPASSPLTWAAFGLFGDDASLPRPPWWLRWWRRGQQRRLLDACRQFTSSTELA
jgi:CHAT domain-containing protein